MKSFLSVCLAVVMLLTLAACSFNIIGPSQGMSEQKYPAPATESNQQTEATAEPVTNEEIETDDSITMLFNPIQEDETAEDGTVIYSYHYQNVVVSMPAAPDVQQTIQDSIADLTKYTKDQSRASASWAKEMYTGEGEWAAHYTHIYYIPNRVDAKVISIAAQMMEFNGGSHPNSTIIPMNFNAETGSELKITEIIASEEQLSTLKEMVFSYLEEEFGKEKLLDGYDEIVDDRFNTATADSANWYLTNEGLVYYFVPYEIAAYRYGTVEAVLNYSSLEGILKEEYLPEETSKEANSIKAALSSELELTFDAVHTVTLDPEGEHITLYGLEKAGSVTVTVGYWGVDDNLFYPTETLFYTDNLAEKECIELVTYIPDAIPNIRIQLGEKNGQTVYLSQSGEDGSILLLKDGEF